jgi:hypothetical protein
MVDWRLRLLLGVGRNLPTRRFQYIIFLAVALDLQGAEEMH